MHVKVAPPTLVLVSNTGTLTNKTYNYTLTYFSFCLSVGEVLC